MEEIKLFGIVAGALGAGLFALGMALDNKNDKKCFGKFKCSKCKNTWTSACCWPGKTQTCKRCRTKVLAYEQRPLKSQDNNELNKPHPQELCEKCQELGFNCIRL